MEKTLNLIKNDPWLEPYKDAIVGRFEHAMDKKAELTNGGKLKAGLFNLYIFLLRYVAPVAIILIFINELGLI